MMRVSSSSCVLLLSLFVGNVVPVVVFVEGFAYAPNFITKRIQEESGKAPIGLLEIEKEETTTTTTTTTAAEETGSTTTRHNSHVPLHRIQTRFPPEPNGYLHLGHAKAICFNFAVARMFDGKCNVRMDDTNPSKEDEEYVHSILADVQWIQSGLWEEEDDTTTATAPTVPWYGPVRKTSDYFDTIYASAVVLIQANLAYVESLSAEEMRDYRGTLTEAGKDSPYKNRTIEENLQLFEEMKEGKYKDGAHVLRAKIDMTAPNINMRDPTLYRIKHERHQETGDTWCIYPMYDFSHPIADAIENVTHSLCTLEFEDHRPFYEWVITNLKQNSPPPNEDEEKENNNNNNNRLMSGSPTQIEFSRLNIKSTVLSKRKLIQLVTNKHVNGWDDPRLPTLSGLRRRGVPPSAIRLFCERVGISKTDSNIDYSVFEDCVREIMDTECTRAFAILEPLRVTIRNWEEGAEEDAAATLEDFEVPAHPKLESFGTRKIPFGKSVYIERSDFFDVHGPEGQKKEGQAPKGFKRLLEQGSVRLRYAYVIKCTEVIRDAVTHEPIELVCDYAPDTRAGVTPEHMTRVKGIIQWVEASTAVPCTINQYDRLFSTEQPGSGETDFLQDLNPHSLTVLPRVVLEPSVLQDYQQSLVATTEKEGASAAAAALSYQFERNGYYALDKDSFTTTGSHNNNNLVFNRVTTLRDTWGGTKKQNQKQGGEGQQRQRGRGGGGKKQNNSGAGTVEDLRRMAFRAVTILSVAPHPDADNLLVCTIDCGDAENEPRTIVTGLAGKIAPEELLNAKVVAVTNLKPSKMRGIESTAMLLAANNDDDSVVELLVVPDSVPNGELLSFEGKETNAPDTLLKSKGALKVWERVKKELRIGEQGAAVYNTTFTMMSTGGTITVHSLTNTTIQ